VIVDPRLRPSYALAIALALGACTLPTGDATGPAELDGGVELDTVARVKHPPPPPPADAGTKPDAGGGGGGGGGDGDPTLPGVISCGASYDPRATCSTPTHCCFSNYSAQHDGECDATSCSWGTVSCDGPEDCASGQHCCAHVMIDPDWGIFGYQIACQAAACGAAPANQELCHTTTSAKGTCSTGTSCVTAAAAADYDLPPALHVCK
jgi:hypothetical protein